MTDRELLERAAKAAGVFLTRETMAAAWPEYVWSANNEPVFDGERLRGAVFWYGEDGEIGGTEELLWNPLANDGAALRLAVALQLDIEHEDGLCPGVWVNDEGELYEVDPYAATRRAIVRAAAATLKDDQ
jgi:hypothetical protein